MTKEQKGLYELLVSDLPIGSDITDEELYRRIDRVIDESTEKKLLSNREKLKQRTLLFSAVRRMDVLSVILDDEEITEIMVNGPDHIFVEKQGKLYPYDGKFTTSERLYDVVQQIASSVNRRVNEASPMVDARLNLGGNGNARVNIVLPPISLDGPAVTIRRFPKEPISMDDLVRIGSLTSEAAAWLRELVRCGYNIFISGGTGAGKTTFLGALAEYIPETERIITIEDSAELRLRKVTNLVRLESRAANAEGEYEVSIRALIRNALRMRPDRIIVGETRGSEAFDMIQAMNTGHDGSLSTGHANSAADMVARLEVMTMMASESLPLKAIRAQITSAIDIIIHLSRFRDRTRKVYGIYEVLGMEEDQVKLSPLFEFREEVTEGEAVSGHLERLSDTIKRDEKLRRRGGRLPAG